MVAEEIRNLADRSAKATADIAGIIRALQEVAQDAIASSNDGLRIADESNSLAETGAGGLRKILSGVGELTSVVGEIARATDEQRSAAQSMVTAVSATVEQARLVATGTNEQATAANGIVQATTQMRRIAQEVNKAIGEQGNGGPRHHQGGAGDHQDGGAGPQGVWRAGDLGEPDHAGRRLDAPRAPATTSRALAEQSTAADQIVSATASLNNMITSVNQAMSEQATASAQVSTASTRCGAKPSRPRGPSPNRRAA